MKNLKISLSTHETYIIDDPISSNNKQFRTHLKSITSTLSLLSLLLGLVVVIPNVSTAATITPASTYTSTTKSAIIGPGGIKNPAVWYKADNTGCTLEANCAAWKDSTIANNPIEGVGTNLLKTADQNHNFHPYFTDFSSANYFKDDNSNMGPSATTNLSIYASARPTKPLTGRITGVDSVSGGGSEPGMGMKSNNTAPVGPKQSYYRNDGASNTTSSALLKTGTNLTWHAISNGTRLEYGVDGTTDQFLTPGTSTFKGSSLVIGNATTPNTTEAGPFPGDIQEVIWHKTALTNFQQQQTLSYLAAKYGSTIDTDYVASNGKTYFEYTTNDPYRFNVAVIGRDDQSGLNQKQSRASMTGLNPIISNLNGTNGFQPTNELNTADFEKNYQFTSIASNARGGTFSIGYKSANQNARNSRVWKVDRYNNTNSMQILIAKDDFSGTNPILLASPDDIVDNKDVNYIPTSKTVNGIEYWLWDNMNFADNEFFSFAGLFNAPGCVSRGLRTWFDPNKINGADNSTVSKWTDTNLGITVAQPNSALQPKLTTNAANFNQGVKFDNDALFKTGLGTSLFPSQSSDLTNIVVLTNNTVGNGSLTNFGDPFNTSSSFPAIGLNGNNPKYDNLATEYSNTFKGVNITPNSPSILTLKDNNSTSRDTTYQYSGNNTSVSESIITGSNLYNLGNSTGGMTIGASNGSTAAEAFQGTMNENVTYDRAIHDEEQKMINTYLALKHGLTLDTDYVGGEVTLWDKTKAGIYHNNVIGIGSQGCESLNQAQSKSSNTTTDPLILTRDNKIAATNAENTAKFTDDSSYLLAGDNNKEGLVDIDLKECGDILIATKRTGKAFRLEQTGMNKSDTNFINVDWLGNYFDARSQMYMMIADDADLLVNRRFVPMTKDGTYWKAPYNIDGVTYVAFIGDNSEPENIQVGDSSIDWAKNRWDAGTGPLNWGPGTEVQDLGNNKATMLVTDPETELYGKSLWSGYPTHYPQSIGNKLHFKGLTKTNGPVTWDLKMDKPAKGASFTIYGLTNSGFTDQITVNAKYKGSPVAIKLTPNSSPKAPKITDNILEGTDPDSDRWTTTGSAKVQVTSNVDEINVEYKAKNTLDYDWWQEFAISNVTLKGKKPFPTYKLADDIYLYKTINPTSEVVNSDVLLEYEIKNMNCATKVLNFYDDLDINGANDNTFVAGSLIKDIDGAPNSYDDNHELYIQGLATKAGSNTVFVNVVGPNAGKFINQASYEVGANKYKSDNMLTNEIMDPTPYEFYVPVKEVSKLLVESSSDKSNVAQEGIVTYTWKITNQGKLPVFVDIQDSLLGMQKFVPDSLVNPLKGGEVKGNGTPQPTALYNGGNIAILEGISIPVGVTEIKIKVDINNEPMGNTLDHQVIVSVVDPTYYPETYKSNVSKVTVDKLADLLPPAKPTCTALPNPNNGTVIVVITCTGVEAGASLTIPLTNCTPTPADATGIVNCKEITPNTVPTSPKYTLVDESGNKVEDTVPYIIDSTAPSKPICTALPNPSNSKSIVVITCKNVEESATLSIDNTTCLPTPALADGIVICTEKALGSVGPDPIVTVADKIGNKVTDKVPLIIDTTAPSIPTIDTIPTTNTDQTPLISGSCEANAEVTVTVNKEVLKTKCIEGQYSVVLTTSLLIGPNPMMIKVTQTDLAGNVSEQAQSDAPVVATEVILPKAPNCTATPKLSNGTKLTTIKCIGVEEGNTITIDGTTCKPTPADNTGIVICTETTPGTIVTNPKAINKDPLNNVNPAIVEYLLDKIAPSAPTIDSIATTNTDTTPTISGNCETDSKVTIKLPSESLTVTCVAGRYSITPKIALPFGPNPDLITATQTDLAGNTSAKTTGNAPVVQPIDPCIANKTLDTCDLDGDGIPNNKDGDIDGDGSDNTLEVGDINGDGIADNIQSDVVTIKNKNGITATLVFEGEGECANPETVYFQYENEFVKPDKNYDYPYGLIGFKVKCVKTVTVTTIWPTLTKAQLAKYRKATNMTPGVDSTFGYIDLPKTDLIINGFNAVKYTVTDGQLGDMTGKDGVIIDPGSPIIDMTDTDQDGVIDSEDSNPSDPCIPHNYADMCDYDKDGKVNKDDLDDDGDGYSDLVEIAAGTNPYDINSTPKPVVSPVTPVTPTPTVTPTYTPTTVTTQPTTTPRTGGQASLIISIMLLLLTLGLTFTRHKR
jgi:Bacterial Ig domain/Bacterial TSP3 repeat